MSSSKSIDFSSLFGDLDPAKAGGAVAAPVPQRAGGVPAREIDGAAEALYVRAASCVSALMAADGVTRDRFAEALSVAAEVYDAAGDGAQSLFDAVFAKDRREDVMVANGVNTAVLAAELVRALTEDREQGVFTVAAALMHDIGMDDCRTDAQRPGVIDDEARSRVSDHPLIGAGRLRALRDEYAGRIADVIEQEHERAGGNGYPRGMRGADIAEAAQIIGICDTYEALTHARPQREAVLPVGAVKTIVSAESLFSQRIVKAFVSRVGLYPRGTYAELNTKEIALVVRQHPQMPASPVVEVVLNAKGEKAAERRIIDLSRGTRIYIVRAV